MSTVCIDLWPLEIVLLAGLFWLPIGIFLGTTLKNWRRHVRKSDEWRGRQG